MRRWFPRASAVLALAALHAHATWTDPVPVGSFKIVKGCGSDSGANIQIFTLSSSTFFRRSTAPGSAMADRMLLASATEGHPAQAFAMIGYPTTSYQSVGDDGACHSANAIEAMGVALDRKSSPTGTSARPARLQMRRLDGNRLLVPSQGDLSVWSPSGARFHPATTTSASGRILDLSALPSGPLFLRVGDRTFPLARI